MMTIKVDRKECPTKPGQYFRKSFDCFGGQTELVTIREYPETYHGGVRFEARLGVVECNTRHPSRFKGTWSEQVTFE